ncbi:MAG: hypothetical protein J0H98_02065 [Solirubrobacterales bacterium]|nr:hypothetical protein [Solirubrobacterales bacterium]
MADDARKASLARRVGGTYLQVMRVYRGWWVDILLLSVVIFVPLGLIDAADAHAIESLGPAQDLKFIALSLGAGLIAASNVLGEVFLAGAIGLSLIHAKDGRPPSLRFLAGHLSYGRLIAVDLSYALVTLIGAALFILPGLAAFTLLALAGPIVEIEGRGVRAAFARSFRLVRIDFWLVFCVLFPIELFGGGIEQGFEHLIASWLGESFIVDGLTEAVSNIALAPLFAIAAALLTRRLIATAAGDAPSESHLKDLRPGQITP